MAHPRMYDDSNPAIQRLRTICLALPEAFEKEAWGECTFRVTGGSMFAMTDNNHHKSGHVAVWVKAPPMVQEILVNADARRFFVPPYMGPKGWVGVRLDYKVDWDELAGILKDGYLMSAPGRLRDRPSPTADQPEVGRIAQTGRSAAKPRATKSTPKTKRRSATKSGTA
ncbi:MAG TPA: MmcQ/YjbR family DNA-binding protein [Candidatus Binatia bacterium]|nr:MmcQ/YjbR family DNA-binding protein [Candidatus Binatia bacterium]